ncbi:hypothetical protein D3C76_1784290 [compost metagenome]
MASRAVGAWRLVTQLGQVQRVGAGLDIADHVGPQASVTAEQLGVGEVFGHEAQWNENQQNVQMETPFQPPLFHRADG